jgi:CheY-like chemotaxis protein
MIIAYLKPAINNMENVIIIIEDDRDDQEMLMEVMQQLNVTRPLVFFEDCESAYEHLLTITEKPFLILCDINLPKVNGIAFKRRLDANEKLRSLSIPFVFLTTSDNPATVQEAYRITNLQGYFRKEHTLEQIKQQIKAILDYWSMALAL